jgi:L-amino acid N-acyltransferase YncA
MSHSIESLRPEDWPEVRAIYLEGIRTGTATFETEVPDWDEWDRTHLAHSRLVARRDDGRLAGWAALSPVSDRCAYGGVAEVSVYVAAGSRGLGVGKALLEALVVASESGGIWTLQAGMFAENEASIALHRRCGFRLVGVRERLGALKGNWHDVVLMERRSPTVGTD